jgi:hypothetical protein
MRHSNLPPSCQRFYMAGEGLQAANSLLGKAKAFDYDLLV